MALLGPLVVLSGQDDADEPYQRGPIGGDADDVGASRIRLSRSWGLLDEICRHAAFGNAVKAKMSGSGGVEVLRDGGKLVGQRVEDPVERGPDGVGVGS